MLNDSEKTDARVHLAQYRVAQALQGACLLGGLLAATVYGLGGLVAGVLGFAVFGLAKPDANADIVRKAMDDSD